MIKAWRDVVLRELKRIWQFKPYLLILTILPLLSILLFIAIFSKGMPTDLPIAVVDNDNTPLSQKVVNMIEATPETAVRYKVTSSHEGERLIRQGAAGAMVIIPANFERDILGMTPTSVGVYISGANILENGLISKDLQTTITTFSTGLKIQILSKQGISENQAIAQAMPIRLDRHILFNPYTNYSYYLLPSFMPMMILIFTVLSTIFAIGSELKYSTAGEWLSTAQGSISVALAGKLTPTLAFMTVMAAVMFILLFEFVGVPLQGNIWILIVSCFMFILSYIAVAIFIIAITADMRLAMSLGGGYSVMAFSLSGLTFPAMAMHKTMQWFGHLFPFTYFTEIIIDQALRGAPIGNSLTQLSYMMIFLLLPLTTARRLKQIINDKKYWGRA